MGDPHILPAVCSHPGATEAASDHCVGGRLAFFLQIQIKHGYRGAWFKNESLP